MNKSTIAIIVVVVLVLLLNSNVFGKQENFTNASPVDESLVGSGFTESFANNHMRESFQDNNAQAAAQAAQAEVEAQAAANQAQVEANAAAQAQVAANNAAAAQAQAQAAANNAANNQVQLPAECYPKDVLQSADLLPQSDTLHSQVVPSGQGALGDKNFLTAGYHVGINTVGQSLRNANRQLRSDPPNPQVKVSPWNQTTIEADINRRPLEIGGQ